MGLTNALFFIDSVFVAVSSISLMFMSSVAKTAGSCQAMFSSVSDNARLIDLLFISGFVGLFFASKENHKIRSLRLLSIVVASFISAPFIGSYFSANGKHCAHYVAVAGVTMAMSWLGAALIQQSALKSIVTSDGSNPNVAMNERWHSLTKKSMIVLVAVCVATCSEVFNPNILLISTICAGIVFAMEITACHSPIAKRISLKAWLCASMTLFAGLFVETFLILASSIYAIWLHKHTKKIMTFMATPEKQVRAACAIFCCCLLATSIFASNWDVVSSGISSASMIFSSIAFLIVFENPIAMMFVLWSDIFFIRYSHIQEASTLVGSLVFIASVRIINAIFARKRSRFEALKSSSVVLLSIAKIMALFLAISDILHLDIVHKLNLDVGGGRLQITLYFNIFLLSIISIFVSSELPQIFVSRGRKYRKLWGLMCMFIFLLVVRDGYKDNLILLVLPISFLCSAMFMPCPISGKARFCNAEAGSKCESNCNCGPDCKCAPNCCNGKCKLSSNCCFLKRICVAKCKKLSNHCDKLSDQCSKLSGGCGTSNTKCSKFSDKF